MEKDSKRILIVDDEENLTWSIANNLRREYKRHEVYSVTSGDQALDILKRLSFNVVISDIKMPGINGLMLLEYVKKHLPDATVILMTSLFNPDLKKIADGSGTYFLEKPFDIAELKRTINRILENGSQPNNSIAPNKKLREVIRENYQNQFTGIYKLKNGREWGEVYFHLGEIVHAKIKDYEGELALIDILNWQNVDFELIKKNDQPLKRTIYYGWKMFSQELIQPST